MGLTRALFPLLKQSPDASVIFVGESHGETPKAYWGGFGASKAALNYLCKVAADEWERFGNLRANVLVPGPINSPQRIKSHPGEAKSERKATGTCCPHLSAGQVPKAKGGAAKSFTSKSGKGRHPARAAIPFEKYPYLPRASVPHRQTP